MKVVKRIKQAIVSMHEARERWEKAKAQAEGKPTIGEGFKYPVVEYLPGVGFSINGVEWRYSSAYIIDHFEKMARDYAVQAEAYEQAKGVADAANDDPVIPF